MPSLENVKSQIVKTDLVIGKQVARRLEIDLLPKILFNDESIKAVVTGRFKDQEVVLIATTQRILNIALSSWVQFPYSDIEFIKSSKMEFEDGKRVDTLQLVTSEGKVEIRYIPYDTTSFVKHVRHYTKSNQPQPSSSSKQTAKAQKGKKTKKWLFYSTVSLLIFIGVYLAMGLFSNRTSQASLGYTPSQFQERWNTAGRDLHSGYAISNMEEVSDGQNQSFTYFLTPDLKMMGIILKDGTIKKMVLIGKPTSDFPLLIEQALLVLDKKLSKQDRETLLHKLGIFNDKKEEQQITKDNIRYSIIYPDKIGIDFEASAVGK